MLSALRRRLLLLQLDQRIDGLDDDDHQNTAHAAGRDAADTERDAMTSDVDRHNFRTCIGSLKEKIRQERAETERTAKRSRRRGGEKE